MQTLHVIAHHLLAAVLTQLAYALSTYQLRERVGDTEQASRLRERIGKYVRHHGVHLAVDRETETTLRTVGLYNQNAVFS